MAPAAADGVAGDDEHARPRRRRRRHLEAGHGELAVAESSMHHSKSMQTHTHQLKRKKGEEKLIEITGRNQKTWPGIFKQQEISQKSLGIFPPHFRFAFFMKKLWRPEQRREKRKARTKEARERFGAKFLPAAGAGSNWVDQDRQEPKKRPWYRIDFF